MTIKAVLSLGLFSIPIKMEQTSKIEKTKFNWISPKGNRVTIKYFDSTTNEELDFSEIRTGYETQKDNFVILSKEEISSLDEDKNKIFIKYVSRTLPTIHQVMKTYHLIPDKSDRPYGLLHHSLLSTKKVLVGTWFTSRRDQLISVSSTKDALVLSQLCYPNELKGPKEIKDRYTPTHREVRLTKSLLQKFGAPNKTKISVNEYPIRLAKLLDSKADINLQKLLEKSLK